MSIHDIKEIEDIAEDFKSDKGPLKLMENYFDSMIPLIGKLINTGLDMKNSSTVENLEHSLDDWKLVLGDYMNQGSKAAEQLYNVSLVGYA